MSPAPELPPPAHRLVAAVLGLGMTSVCVVMAAAAASERATTDADRWLVTATAAAFVVGAHVLPAVSRRRPAMWLLAGLCLVATLYHLSHFYAAAGLRAGQQRGVAAAESAQAQALRAELAGMAALPVAQAAADLAKAQGTAARAAAALARCQGPCGTAQAVSMEARAREAAAAVALDEARRAAALAADLRAQAAGADAARAAALVDPVDAQIAHATGVPVATVALLASLAQGLLLEVLGMVAWAIALPRTAAAPVPRVPQAHTAQPGEAVPPEPLPAAAGREPVARLRPSFPARSALHAAHGARDNPGTHPAPAPASAAAERWHMAGWRGHALAWWRRATAVTSREPPWPHAAPH